MSYPYIGFEAKIKHVYEVNNKLIVISNVSYDGEVLKFARHHCHCVTVNTSSDKPLKIKHYALGNIDKSQKYFSANDDNNTVKVVQSLEDIPELQGHKKIDLLTLAPIRAIKDIIPAKFKGFFSHKKNYKVAAPLVVRKDPIVIHSNLFYQGLSQSTHDKLYPSNERAAAMIQNNNSRQKDEAGNEQQKHLFTPTYGQKNR